MLKFGVLVFETDSLLPSDLELLNKFIDFGH